MSSNPYKQVLEFKPQASRQLLLLMIIMHSAAGLIVLFLLNLPMVQQALLLLIISLAGYFSYRLHYQKTLNASIIAIRLNAENQWSITLAKQAPLSVVLLDSSLLSHYLMILNFKAETGKRYSIILAQDTIEAQLARQIRARIKVMSASSL